MTTTTRQPLKHWQGQGSDQRLEEWQGLEDIYDQLTSGEFEEFTIDLSYDELLRLSLYTRIVTGKHDRS